MIDVLIPFYPDVERRQKIWDYNRGLWSSLPRTHVLVGEDALVVAGGRPFSPARARNAAALAGDGEWILTYGSDELPPTEEVIQESVDRAERGPGWAGMFSGTRVLKVASTDALIDGALELAQARLMTRIPSAMGLVVVRRELFERVGGYDERFEGWGFEDTALRKVLTVVAGTPDPPPKDRDCWSLSPARVDLVAQYRDNLSNRELYEREYDMVQLPLRRRSPLHDGPAGIAPPFEARDYQRARWPLGTRLGPAGVAGE